MDDVIHGYVPGPSSTPPASEVAKKRTGWPKGKPRGPRNALVAIPPPPMPAGACPGCSKQTAPISLELLHGLLRVARDRLLEEGSATFDVLYLAARGEGYCSLTCWRVNAATDDQLSLLERRKK